MKKSRKIIPILVTMFLIISMVTTSFALEINGVYTSGIQIGDVYYTMDYIIKYSDEFSNIFGPAMANPENIIIDMNRQPVKYSDYMIADYPTDFDAWSSKPQNQTQPNPQAYVGSDGNEIPIIEEDDEKITDAKAEGFFATNVTGKYALDVDKIEVIYGDVIKEAALNDGTFTWGIFPGLTMGTEIIIKAYVGDNLVDIDVITVEEDDEKITDAKAEGSVVTNVTGKYASDVDKVEVIYGDVIKEAALNDGTFTWGIFPGLTTGTEIIIKAYVRDNLVDIDVITVGDHFVEKEFKVINIL